MKSLSYSWRPSFFQRSEDQKGADDVNKENRKKETWECPVCGAENDEEDEICINCGCCQEEPCYDAINDEEDE